MVCPTKFEGTDALEIFTLEEDPCNRSRIKLTTGQHRSVVRNAMQNTNGLVDRCKGYVNHVCGRHDLWRKALRPENGVVAPIISLCTGNGRHFEKKTEYWSGKRDLNPRPSPWQGDALPLSYSRSITVGQRGGILLSRNEAVKQPSRPHTSLLSYYLRYNGSKTLLKGNLRKSQSSY